MTNYVTSLNVSASGIYFLQKYNLLGTLIMSKIKQTGLEEFRLDMSKNTTRLEEEDG